MRAKARGTLKTRLGISPETIKIAICEAIAKQAVDAAKDLELTDAIEQATAEAVNSIDVGSIQLAIESAIRTQISMRIPSVVSDLVSKNVHSIELAMSQALQGAVQRTIYRINSASDTGENFQ